MLSTVTNYDSQFVSASSRSTGQVYDDELGGSHFEIDSLSEFTEDLDYDIDTSAKPLLENMTNSGNSNSDSYLPSEHCSSLTPEERDSWIKLPPNMKSEIIKGTNRKNRPNNRFNSDKSNNPSHKTIKHTS